MAAAYHQELIDQAVELVSKNNPTQADVRRAISAAYYAVFHLLVADAAAYWSDPESRHSFARIFEHSALRRASNRILTGKIAPSPALKMVAKSFVFLQDERYLAEYHNGAVWTPTEALEDIAIAREAFDAWQLVRHELEAKEYLISFLIRPRD